MQRYGYETISDGELGYEFGVFDRIRGTVRRTETNNYSPQWVAVCSARHDAELIVAALNSFSLETTTKPSNHITITLPDYSEQELV